MSRFPPWVWPVTAVLLVAGVGSAAAATGEGGPKRPSGPLPVLKLGASGPFVAFLRALLRLPPGDSFDADVRDAIVALQKLRGLAADGVVGPKTWAALGFSDAAKPANPVVAAPKPVQAFTPAASTSSSSADADLATSVAERESQILSAVSSGRADIQWTTVTSSAGGRVAKFVVTRRAVAVDVGGRVIPSMSFAGATRLADAAGARLLTSRLADLIWQQASTRLQPLTRTWNTDAPVTGTSTSRMLQQSAAIDAAVGGASGLVANEGKDWVVTRRFWPGAGNSGSEAPHGTPGSRHNGANFGWYGIGNSRSPGGELVVQSIGLAHERGFVDYSQLVRLVQTTVIVDGLPTSIDQIASDPSLSALLSDEGPLPSMRHPDL